MFDWPFADMLYGLFAQMGQMAWIILTAVVTFLGSAIIMGMRKRADTDVNSLGAFVAGAILFHPVRVLRERTSLYLSFDYSKRQLERSATKYLQVPSRDDVKLETDSVFVPLTLEGQVKPYDHTTLLQAGTRIRIIGDPGSGKSTILKRMLRDQCRLLAKWRTAQTGRLPIIIELRNLKPPTQQETDLGDWLLNLLIDEIKRFSGYDMESCVKSFLEGQGLVVLFDGADEISAEHYHSIQTSLNVVSERLAAKSTENVVVITMRSQFHLQVRDRYAQQYPAVLHIKAFSPSDIYELLNKWPFHSNGSHHAARIYADLSDRPSLREICYNPLILSMYIAEDQRRLRETGGLARNVQVPDSRTEFYHDVVEEFLLKRREAQSGQQAAARAMVKRKRQQFFGGLCYNHLLDAEQAANAIPFANAVALIKIIYVVNLPDPDAENTEAERILRELSSQTGLFSEEREGEQLRFIHLSFVEYFSALHAIEQEANGWNDIVSRHQTNILTGVGSLTTRLRELFPFAVHLAHQKDQPRYLADVCHNFVDSQLKASCFLETKAYQSEAWREFASDLPEALESLLPRLENEEDAQAFYVFVAALRDAEAHGCATSVGGAETLDEILSKILLKERRVALRAIDLMAHYDAVAALRLADLCRMPLLKENPHFLIRNAEQPAFLGQIIQRALRENTEGVPWLIYAGMASCFIPAARAELLAKEPLATLAEGDTAAKRFWIRLFGLKRQSLFTQILGCIAQCANDHARLDKELPYSVRRFVVDALVSNHLRDVERRILIRKLLRGMPFSVLAVSYYVLLAKATIHSSALELAIAFLYFVVLTNSMVFYNTRKDKDALFYAFSSNSLLNRYVLKMFDGLYYLQYGAYAAIIRNFYRDMKLATPDLGNSQSSGKLFAIKVSTKMHIVDLHFNRRRFIREVRIYKSIRYFLYGQSDVKGLGLSVGVRSRG